MALGLQPINIGASDNDPNADNLRVGGGKINDNFEKLEEAANNVGKKIFLGWVDAGTTVNAALFVAKMNARVTEITEKDTPVIVYINERGSDFGGITYRAAAVHSADFLAGAGKYSTADTAVSSAMLWMRSPRNLLPADINDAPGVTIEPLEVPDGENFVDVANEQFWDWSDSGTDTEEGIRQYFFTFAGENPGEFIFAFFGGPAGEYGDGATPFTNEMFSLSTKTGLPPEKTNLSQFVNDGDGESPFAMITDSVYADEETHSPSGKAVFDHVKLVKDVVVDNDNVVVPYDKSAVDFTAEGTYGAMYGQSDLFFKRNELQNVKIKAYSPGSFVFRFYDESFNLLYIYTGYNYYPGYTTVTAAEMELPDFSAYNKVYLFVGNNQKKDANVIMFNTSAGAPRTLYILNLADGIMSTYPAFVSEFNVWLNTTVVKDQITQDVTGLNAAVKKLNTLNYDYTKNFQILPSDLFIVDKFFTPVYRKSLSRSLESAPEISLLSGNRVIPILEPTELRVHDVADTARFIVNKNNEDAYLLYKDVNILKAALTDKVGQTIKWMPVGNSVTEGGDGTLEASPVYHVKLALEALGINVTTLGTLERTYSGTTIRYEGRGGWRPRTYTGMESYFAGVPVTIPSPTQNVFVEGVDGTMVEIKQKNTWLYESTTDDQYHYPEWCFHFDDNPNKYNRSYADQAGLGTYYIFDPARYLSERGIDAPDVLSIALGTNDWYLNDYTGFDLNLISKNLDWMITRLRAAMPDTKILLIPSQPLSTIFDTEWEQKGSKLAAEILRLVEAKKAAGDTNIFTLSIFAHGSRHLSYDTLYPATNLSITNSTKVAEIVKEVHSLNEDNQSRHDYVECLKDALICFTEGGSTTFAQKNSGYAYADTVQPVIRQSEVIDFPNVGTSTSAAASPFTVTGAAVGDVVDIVPHPDIIALSGFERVVIRACVTAADTVTAYITNNSTTGSFDAPARACNIIIRK